MSFKVGDEVVTVVESFIYPKDAEGVVVNLAGALLEVDFGDNAEVRPNNWILGHTRVWYCRPDCLTHADPLVADLREIQAKVEQLEAEVNAWIERMRRGEF